MEFRFPMEITNLLMYSLGFSFFSISFSPFHHCPSGIETNCSQSCLGVCVGRIKVRHKVSYEKPLKSDICGILLSETDRGQHCLEGERNEKYFDA